MGEAIPFPHENLLVDEHPLVRKVRVPYGHEIESHLGPLTEKAEALDLFEIPHPPRWVAIKALEEDKEMVQAIRNTDKGGLRFLEEIKETRDHLYALYGEEPETVFTERLYGFVAGILKEVYTDPPLDRISRSDRIDAVLTHKILGLPVGRTLLGVIVAGGIMMRPSRRRRTRFSKRS